MNILFLTNLYPNPRLGGIERVTNLLAKALAGEGYSIFNLYFEATDSDHGCPWVSAACMDGQWEANRLSAYLDANSINCIINQSHFFYTPVLREAIGHRSVKLITCFHNAPHFVALNMRDAVANSRSSLKPLIPFLYPIYKRLSVRKLRKQHRTSCLLSDVTVLLSPSYIPIYKTELGVAEDKLACITNPLTYDECIAPEGMARKENICLVVARLYEQQKRISLVLKAWERLQQQEAWRLVIVGDGEDRTMYERYVQEHGLQRVEFIGRTDPRPYYERSKLFLMTSEIEGWGMTLVESMQMGVVPVVMDSFIAVHDLIEDGVNGHLVTYGEVNAFVHKVGALMQDEPRRMAYAAQGFNVASRFSNKEIMERWIRLLNRE